MGALALVDKVQNKLRKRKWEIGYDFPEFWWSEVARRHSKMSLQAMSTFSVLRNLLYRIQPSIWNKRNKPCNECVILLRSFNLCDYFGWVPIKINRPSNGFFVIASLYRVQSVGKYWRMNSLSQISLSQDNKNIVNEIHPFYCINRIFNFQRIQSHETLPGELSNYSRKVRA